MRSRRLRMVLGVAGFLVASVAVGVLDSLIVDRTGQTWVRWPLMAAVIVPAVFLVFRYAAESSLSSVGDGEKVWVASVPFVASTSFRGRSARVGGVLVLGADAVTFRPYAGIGRTRRYPLGSIVGVERFADRPPRLRIGLDDGRAAVFIVPATFTSPIWSRNATARDEAVGEIAARLDAVQRGTER